MKTMLAMCPDGRTAVTVKMGTKHRRWAYFIEVRSELPVFVYVGHDYRTVKRQLIDFIKEGGDDIADGDRCRQMAERLFNRSDFDLFGDDCEGQATYFNGLTIVGLRPDASQYTVVHECVHSSQFMLRFNYGNSDVSNNDVLELQPEIVENLFALICAILKRLKTRTNGR